MAKAKQMEVKYYLNSDNEFVIENYNFPGLLRIFSPELPGNTAYRSGYSIPTAARGSRVSELKTRTMPYWNSFRQTKPGP